MGVPCLSPGSDACDWSAAKHQKTSADDGKSMKISNPKSMRKERLVIGETPGEVSSHNAVGGRMVVPIASDNSLFSCHMIRNRVSDWHFNVLLPPRFLPPSHLRHDSIHMDPRWVL